VDHCRGAGRASPFGPARSVHEKAPRWGLSRADVTASSAVAVDWAEGPAARSARTHWRCRSPWEVEG